VCVCVCVCVCERECTVLMAHPVKDIETLISMLLPFSLTLGWDDAPASHTLEDVVSEENDLAGVKTEPGSQGRKGNLTR